MTIEMAIRPFIHEWIANQDLVAWDEIDLSFAINLSENAGFPQWLKIVIFDDRTLIKKVPLCCMRSSIYPYPLFVFESDIKQVAQTLQTYTIPSFYYLIWQAPYESILICFERASKIAKYFSEKQIKIRYVVAFYAGDKLNLHVQFYNQTELLNRQNQLWLATNYLRIVKQKIPNESECPKIQGRLIELKAARGKRAMLNDYLGVTLQKKIAPLGNEMQGNILLISDEKLPSNVDAHMTSPVAMKWASPNHFAWLYVNRKSISDEEVCAGWLNEKISFYHPLVLVWNCELIPNPNSPLGPIWAAFLATQKTIFICHDTSETLVWQPLNAQVSIANKAGLEGKQIFVATLTVVGNRRPPQKFSCSANAENFIHDKYSVHTAKILAMSNSGVKEKEIALVLGIPLTTLRWLKRRAGIRKNAPLKKKRRTGMDAKIKKLLAQEKSPREVAKILNVTPSYITRQIKAWEAKSVKPPYNFETLPPPQG